MTSYHRSFLKWAGGKYRALKYILPHFPLATRLIEPFAGSGVITLNTEYPSHVLSDANPDLIHFYRILKNEGPDFIQYCESFFNQKKNTQECYYQFRDEFNKTHCLNQRSALFLYLNRHGYNGLCRYNQKGRYNVPFGHYKAPYFPKKELFLFYEKSKKIEIYHQPFTKTFSTCLPGDLIYCDPPYAPRQQKSNFSAYLGTSFTEQDQKKLNELAQAAAHQGCIVIISNHDTPFTRALYQEAQILSFNVSRCISSCTSRRMAVPELLAIFK